MPNKGVKNVFITVKHAELTKSFIMYGQMDPYATVEWIDGISHKKEPMLARTHTDWNAHYKPVWDFTCRGHKCNLEEKSDDMVLISVFEDDGQVLGSKRMGSAQASVKKLLGISHKASSLRRGSWADSTITGPVLELDLSHKDGSGTSIGKIFVQARAAPANLHARATNFTRVDRDMFEEPVKRLGVSGGTAPFFQLTLSKKSAFSCPSYYIGKDLSRASDEIEFYEELLFLKQQPAESDDANGLRLLLDFTFEYLGVFTALEDGQPDSEPPKEVLVLENLANGCEKLRMLDLKIGRQTAQAGWQGKSPMRAWKQYLLDGTTNSVTEGYRLEGFSNMPSSLESREPLLEIPHFQNTAEKFTKKARRIMLQSLPADHIFMYFLDLRQNACDEEGDDSEPLDEDEFYSSVELTELILHELVQRLIQLSIACHRVKIPQKWIGSSVALGFDSGFTPSRGVDPDAVRSKVRVNIFDWGRSELNTIEKHMDRETEDDRSRFWGYYKEGIDILSWNAARTYYRQFSCQSWTEIEIKVLDFDMHQRDEYMGKITLPVENTPMKRFTLKSNNDSPAGQIFLSIKWWDAPEGSRLKGSWRIHISNANGLSNKDTFSLSDPYCLITAVSPTRCFQQVSSVKEKTLNPVFNETFDLPLAEDPLGNLVEALECDSKDFSNIVEIRNILGFEADKNDLNDVRVCYKLGIQRTREDVEKWSERLQEAAKDTAPPGALPSIRISNLNRMSMVPRPSFWTGNNKKKQRLVHSDRRRISFPSFVKKNNGNEKSSGKNDKKRKWPRPFRERRHSKE